MSHPGDMESESAEIFSTPDLSDLDPSTQGGYRLLFAREWYVAGRKRVQLAAACESHDITVRCCAQPA